MAKYKDISNNSFIAVTITDALSDFPEASRTAWLDLNTNQLYISAVLVDLKTLYLEAKKLEPTREGLPIIQHNDDLYVDVAWVRKIIPGQAGRFRYIEQVFLDALFNSGTARSKH